MVIPATSGNIGWIMQVTSSDVSISCIFLGNPELPKAWLHFLRPGVQVNNQVYGKRIGHRSMVNPVCCYGPIVAIDENEENRSIRAY